MSSYVVRRLVETLMVVVGVTLLVFCLSHLSGDPVSLMLPMDTPRAERERMAAAMGLDRPLTEQYWRFASGAVRGDFGRSILFRRSALEVVRERLGATVELAGAATALALLTGIPLGVAAAVRAGGWVDRVVTALTTAGQSVATFWLGIMLMMALGVKWHLLPISGRGTPAHMVMPAFTLCIPLAVVLARLTRSSLLGTLAEGFVRTARAKGLAERAVIYRHALRNALIPVVTVMGVQLGQLLGGAVITEQVFAWPGMGYLAVTAVRGRDFPVIQAATVVGALAVVLCNLAVDFLYHYLDPRVRIRGGAA